MTPLELLPTRINLVKFKNQEDYFDKQYHIIKKLNNTTQIDCFGYFRENAEYLICLLPSAQASSQEISNPIFHRWSWYQNLKNNNVLSISDPALYTGKMHANWFLSNERNNDYITEISDFIEEISYKVNINKNKIILYGSSMGGFGALMIASKLKESFTIVEVPQIDLTKYSIKNAIKSIEVNILENDSILNFSKKFPEKINVYERWKLNKAIPSFRLITNVKDNAYQEHLDFFISLNKLNDEVESIGDKQLTIISEEIGHKPLSTEYGIQFIKNAINEGWNTINKNLNPVELEKELTYDELIKECVSRSQNIKYIRDEKETIEYSKIKEMLYKASEININADWPYLKICSMTKLWTNSFNEEILNAALNAFNKKQSLESFIYICRGLIYNKDYQLAEIEIDNLIKITLDKDISNIGNIFKAIIAYEGKNYSEYEMLIKTFKENKNNDFNAYITIPVSTVYTNGSYADANYDYNNVKLINKELKHSQLNIENKKYIISASCDETYFFKYAKFLIKSFDKFCADEATLFLSIIDGNLQNITKSLREWEASDSVIINIENLKVSNNIGPTASLLRFSHVFQLLHRYELPVFVLDLDTVIKKSFLEIVNTYNKVDIGSRILGKGVAPWEKYTGGFALFNPTEIGKLVAKNIAFVAENSCSDDSLQWWIDQNCFETGIRSIYQMNKNLNIENLFSIRDKFCIMPVGSGDSKIYNLEKALSDINSNI